MANCEQMLMGRGKPQNPKVRDERIDSVKYWLIVLVIAGHVIDSYREIPKFALVWNWIYIFHMPLFIFISGYFSNKKDDVTEFQKGLWNLIEPLLVFQNNSNFSFHTLFFN